MKPMTDSWQQDIDDLAWEEATRFEHDIIRAEGKPLGRFTWQPDGNPSAHAGDWSPDPEGTHDAYEHNVEIHLFPRTEPTQ